MAAGPFLKGFIDELKEKEPGTKKSKHLKRGISMDVKNYCSNVREEIVSRKSQIDNFMKKADRRSGDMDQTAEAIHKINTLVNELESIVSRLETECPADWSSEKARLDEILSEFDRLWQEAAAGSPDDF